MKCRLLFVVFNTVAITLSLMIAAVMIYSHINYDEYSIEAICFFIAISLLFTCNIIVISVDINKSHKLHTEDLTKVQSLLYDTYYSFNKISQEFEEICRRSYEQSYKNETKKRKDNSMLDLQK